MPQLLSATDFTQHLAAQLKPFEIAIQVPEPLVIELHYGEDKPVLTIALRNIYDQYLQTPSELSVLLEPFVSEVSWSVKPPRYTAQEIFERTLPVMKDIMLDPFAQDFELIALGKGEEPQRLPKGPPLFVNLISHPDEHLIVQFMLDTEKGLVQLYRGDVLTCFPQVQQIAAIAIQNLAKRALQSGLTTRAFKVENFQTELLLIGFRSSQLNDYVASLISVSDVMLALERNLGTNNGLLAIVPSRDQLLLSTTVSDHVVCEMWLLARHLKGESDRPVSSLVWRVNQGEITAVQTVNLEAQE
ncbi:MAG: hypothetical protein HY711_09365 [Candidatus Melainabacteria bacterium]|nr:hypothetical protein [Candidatus Melainabacteria bacterium]